MTQKLHNRILSALLALVLVLTGFPVAAFAEGESVAEPETALCDVCGEEVCICTTENEVCEACGNEVCTCEAEAGCENELCGCDSCACEACACDGTIWDQIVDCEEIQQIGYLGNESVVFFNDNGDEYTATEYPDYLILTVAHYDAGGNALVYQVESSDSSFQADVLDYYYYVETGYVSAAVSAAGLYATVRESEDALFLYRDISVATDVETVSASTLGGEYVVVEMAYSDSLYGWFVKVTADDAWPVDAEYSWFSVACLDTLSQTATRQPEDICEVCGQANCESDHENWCEICQRDDCGLKHISATVIDSSGNEQTVTVTGDSLPEGATLEVTALGLDEEQRDYLCLYTEAVPVDIKVIDAGGNEWQPSDGQSVSVQMGVSGFEEGEQVAVVHILESAEEISEAILNGSAVVDDLSQYCESLCVTFERQIAAWQEATGNNEKCAAAIIVRELEVVNGTVSFETNSFSTYYWADNRFYETSTSDGHNADNKIKYYTGTFTSSCWDKGTVYLTADRDVYVQTAIARYAVWEMSQSGSYVSFVERGTPNLGSTRWEWARYYVASGAPAGYTFTITAADVSREDDRTITFVVVEERSLDYNGNGKSCTLPSSSSWVTTGSNAGSNTHVYPSSITIGTPSNTPAGYTFSHWTTNADGSGTRYNSGDTFNVTTTTANTTLYAQWTPLYKYSLIFNSNAPNGATVSGMPSNQSSSDWESGSSKTYSWTNVPSCSGYTFLGWSTNASDTTGTKFSSYELTGTGAGTTTVTLYAIWAYTVTYEANGGSGAPSSQTTSVQKNTTLSSVVPTQDGYTFLGWQSSYNSAVYQPGGTYPKSYSTTMTALWGKQDSSSSWNNYFYVLPGTSGFGEHLRNIDGIVRAATKGNITGDSNVYYVAPGSVLTFARTGALWRIDGAESNLTLTAGSSTVGNTWSAASDTVTLTVNGSASVGTTMMIYNTTASGTSVYCAKIVVQTAEQITKWATNDPFNSFYIYRVGVYIIYDSRDIPGEPKYTSNVSMFNVAGMNFASSGAGIVSEDIASAEGYISSLDGTCTMGVVDYTGKSTLPYLDDSVTERATTRLIEVLKAGTTTVYAADGTNLTEYYATNGEDAVRANYEVRPHIVKLMTGLAEVNLGWHIDCSVYAVTTRTLTYNLNPPTGYVLKSLGTPDPETATSSDETVTVTVTSDIAVGASYTATVTGASDTASLTFDGWNTKADGTGTNYIPGSTLTLENDTVLYAKWSGGSFTTGTLDVYKEVSTTANSDEPSSGDSFSFSIDLTGSYAYTIYTASSGAKVSSGTMTDGMFSLQDGQFIRFANVPVGTYTVKETALPEHYSSNSTTQTVDLVGGYVNQLTFINTYTNIPSFAVTGSIGNGEVTNGNQSVQRGSSSIAMVFTPDVGYEISSITVNGNAVTVTDSLKRGYTYPAQTNVTGNHIVVVTTASITYLVSYDTNGGTGAIVNQSKSHGTALTLSNGSGLSRSGYTLTGWNTQADGSGAAYRLGGTYSTNEDLKLYAQWEINTYTVTVIYDSAHIVATGLDGFTKISDGKYKKTVHYYDEISIGFTPNPGYAIQIKVNGDSIATANPDGDSVKRYIESDTEIKVDSALINYTIEYNLGGGTEDPENPTSYTIESADITLLNPTKTGYTFAGWTGTGLDEATETVTIAKGSTGDRSYTATWTMNTLTIKQTGVEATDSGIYEVRDSGNNVVVAVMITGNDSVTIELIPSGTYTVKEIDGDWTWIYADTTGQSVNVSGETEVTFTHTGKHIDWLHHENAYVLPVSAAISLVNNDDENDGEGDDA